MKKNYLFLLCTLFFLAKGHCQSNIFKLNKIIAAELGHALAIQEQIEKICNTALQISIDSLVENNIFRNLFLRDSISSTDSTEIYLDTDSVEFIFYIRNLDSVQINLADTTPIIPEYFIHNQLKMPEEEILKTKVLFKLKHMEIVEYQISLLFNKIMLIETIHITPPLVRVCNPRAKEAVKK